MKAGLNGAGRIRQVIEYFIAFSQEQSLSVLRLLVMSDDAAKCVPWCTYLMTVRMKISTPYDTDNYHMERRRRGVVRGVLGYPCLPPHLANNRWRKRHDNLLSTVILSQWDPTPLKNPCYDPGTGVKLENWQAVGHRDIGKQLSLGIFEIK